MVKAFGELNHSPGNPKDRELAPPTGSGREGNGNPLQYSYLENPMGGGAGWAAVYGVAESRTRLKQLSSSSSSTGSGKAYLIWVLKEKDILRKIENEVEQYW